MDRYSAPALFLLILQWPLTTQPYHPFIPNPFARNLWSFKFSFPASQYADHKLITASTPTPRFHLLVDVTTTQTFFHPTKDTGSKESVVTCRICSAQLNFYLYIACLLLSVCTCLTI